MRATRGIDTVLEEDRESISKQSFPSAAGIRLLRLVYEDLFGDDSMKGF